jgi:hypothetical protein
MKKKTPHSTPPSVVDKAQTQPGDASPLQGRGSPLPHETDESTSNVASAPDPQVAQAKRDLDAGMVDTDMRATPGLDADLRKKMVPGPGGEPPDGH